MKVTLEITNFEELEKVLLFFKSINLDKVEVNYKSESSIDPLNDVLEKGDKTQDPTALFGIWKDNPRSLEEIRNKNWKRNWEL